MLRVRMPTFLLFEPPSFEYSFIGYFNGFAQIESTNVYVI